MNMEHKAVTDNPVLEKDLEELIQNSQVDWDRLAGKHILVTGATGLIGSVTVRALILANIRKNLGMTVTALVRNPRKAQEMLGPCLELGLRLLVTDVTKEIQADGPVDYILHGAGVTTSKDFVDHPVETILTTLEGTRQLLELARRKQASGMVYFSSMEAYGVVDPDHFIVRETDYGYIDPLQPRSSYSESKRMAEGLCAAYAHEYGVPVMTVRLAQTFGAGIPRTENRVYAQFAKSIMNHQDIVLHTDGQKAHSYCYTADAVTGILTVLLRGTPGEAYNVSNEETFCTIREMAEMLTRQYPESGSRLVFDIPEDASLYGYAPPSRMLVNAEKLRALGWEPHVDLPRMYDRLIAALRADEE